MRVKCFIMGLVLVAGTMLSESGTRLLAQEPTDKTPFKDLKVDAADGNSDGKVTTEELKKFLAERYVNAWAEKIDLNRNGKISKREFRLARQALEQLFVEESKVASSAKSATPNKPPTMIERMNARFLTQNPQLGSTVNSLIAFNEDGEEVDFKDFRGKHVVIVFGCLT